MAIPSDWKPAVMIWRWEDAPEELRQLWEKPVGDEESLLFIPSELLNSDGEYVSRSWSLFMLQDIVHGLEPDAERFGGNGWGMFSDRHTQNGDLVIATRQSKPPERPPAKIGNEIR